MAIVEIDRESVRTRLGRVDDPELDESIVDLDYIEDIDIDGLAVAVRFTLPTAWCSPAFAWMMATGAREEVEDLPGVENCEIRLTDHMHAEEINRGVNEGLVFETIFPDAEDGIEAVRRTLDETARMSRQHQAVETLLDAGLDPEQIVGLTRKDVTIEDESALVSLADGALVVPVPAEPLAEYLQKAETVEVVTDSTDRLFATPDSDSIPLGEFDYVHHRARLAATNVTGQGSICEGLNEARNG